MDEEIQWTPKVIDLTKRAAVAVGRTMGWVA